MIDTDNFIYSGNPVIDNFIGNDHFMFIYMTYNDFMSYKSSEIIPYIKAMDDILYYHKYLRLLDNKPFYYILVYSIDTLKDIGFVEDLNNKNSNIVFWEHFNISLPPAITVLTIEDIEGYI